MADNDVLRYDLEPPTKLVTITKKYNDCPLDVSFSQHSIVYHSSTPLENKLPTGGMASNPLAQPLKEE